MTSPSPPDGDRRACPVCGGRSHTHFADERIDPARLGELSYAARKPPEFMCLRLVRCLDCDLVYAPAPPLPERLGASYAAASFDAAPEADAAAATYARILAPHVANQALRGAAIDVGAGNGALLPWLQAQGYRPVVGIEPSGAAISAAPPERRPLLRHESFDPASVADMHTGLICSFMTLEHLPDPGGFVARSFELLAPGGMLALVVHDWRAPLNRLLGPRSAIIDIEHLQLFSRRPLARLLSGAGFEAVRVSAFANRYPLHYWLRLAPLPRLLGRSAARVLRTFGLADVNLSLRVGNLLAIGVKPGGAS